MIYKHECCIHRHSRNICRWGSGCISYTESSISALEHYGGSSSEVLLMKIAIRRQNIRTHATKITTQLRIGSFLPANGRQMGLINPWLELTCAKFSAYPGVFRVAANHQPHITVLLHFAGNVGMYGPISPKVRSASSSRKTLSNHTQSFREALSSL